MSDLPHITVACILRDNDPRSNGRTVEVIAIDRESGVLTVKGRTTTKINPRFTRLYTDNKERRSGFSLVGTL